jgi:hypothetical protein
VALEGELDDHLGYSKHDPAGRNGGNSRNGYREKTVITDTGPVEQTSSTSSLTTCDLVAQLSPPRHHPSQAALSYSDLLRQVTGECLSPPLGHTAPHGADRRLDRPLGARNGPLPLPVR